MATHNYGFEIWPADAGERTLPLRVSRFALTPEDARHAVESDLRPGNTVLLVAHNRGRCNPPHAGEARS